MVVRVDDAYRRSQRDNLKRTLDNPKAAESAFPDPDQRAKILPLMTSLHEMESALEQRLAGTPRK